MYGWGMGAAEVPAAPVPVGRSFWDFVASTQDQSVESFASKYRVALGVGGLLLAVGLFALSGRKGS